VKRFVLFILLFVAGCQFKACPSQAGGSCDPRNANCPTGYACSLSEICTRACEQTPDCWVKDTEGCRSNELPGQRLPDGGVFTEMSDDGFCGETKLLSCVDGYCQRAECADGGCDYDVYGPSPFKGNRSQGPEP
jgi:hypothetical protein